MLHWLDYALFAAYLLATAGVGSMFFKRKSDLSGYLQGSHQMHSSVVAISIIASLFSGISYLSSPSETFHYNLVYTWSLASYFVATPITAYVFLPFYFKLNLYSAYEYLERRFDSRVRTISSASFIFRAALWMSLAIYAPALVLAEMIGLPLWISVVITGLGTTAYTTLGGMKAVIWTEVLQFFVLIAGVVVIIFVAADRVPDGMQGAWKLAAAEGRTKLFDMRLDPRLRMTFWGAFIGGIPLVLSSMAADQMSVQRYLTTSSLREGQRAMWLQMLLTVPMCIVFYLTGTVLFGFYAANPGRLGALEQPDRIFPYFVIHELPTPMPGLLIAAVFAATMWTISGGLNALATVTLVDFFARFRGKPYDDAESVKLARTLTIAYGIFTTGLAMFVGKLGSLIEIIGLMGGLMGGPMLGIFLLAVFSRRTNGTGTLIGAIIGTAVVLAVALYSDISFMWHCLISTCVTVAVGWVCSLFFPSPSAEQQANFVYSGAGRRAMEKADARATA